jgi:serine/threonine protein kinase
VTICRSCGDQHDASTSVCPRTNESVTVGPCGTTIDRYEIEKRLGGGGFGSVYRAKHTGLGQHVALKILLSRHAHNREVVARFVREAKSAASIKSGHIVAVTDFGTTAAGEAFLVMELLEGRDLETVLIEEGKFAIEWALRFTEQILEGLASAHAVGVIHRDMKPANVFVTRASDGSPWLKLVDFGISKAAALGTESQGLTRTGAVIGTPSYMSPEQFTGMSDVDHRTDLYAVTVILYQMLSGRLPYEEETYERLILKVVTEGPRPLRAIAPELPEPLLQLVDKGLQKEPAARFQSAHEFKDAVHHLLGRVTDSGRRSAPPPSAAIGNTHADARAPSHMQTPAMHAPGIHTPAMHTALPQHQTPQRQTPHYQAPHYQTPQPHYPTPHHATPQPHYPTPQAHYPTPQPHYPAPQHYTPTSQGQPSTPMAFDRHRTPSHSQSRGGPSAVLIAFAIFCGVGLLGLVGFWSSAMRRRAMTPRCLSARQARWQMAPILRLTVPR